MITIYHNNRCSKSRCALQLLEESGTPYEVVEYLKETPSEEELQSLLKKLKMKPFELVRKSEPLFLEKYKGKDLSDEKWIKVLHENPILIERPIVVNGRKAVVARPPEKIHEIL